MIVKALLNTRVLTNLPVENIPCSAGEALPANRSNMRIAMLILRRFKFLSMHISPLYRVDKAAYDPVSAHITAG